MLTQKTSTLDDARSIRVLVVPIGENSLFDEHYQTISQLREVRLDGLSKPSEWNVDIHTGFKHFDWYGKGNLLFDYLRYDRVPNGPGDLDDFQSSRRVLMIMGLINYPELGPDPVTKIHQELEYFSRRHPNVVLRRLFLFNYSFDGEYVSDPHKELLGPTLKDPHIMIVFPPDLACDNGLSMVKVHLNVNIENAAIKIVQSFDERMRICENSCVKQTLPDEQHKITLSTFFDEIEERTALQGRERETPSRSQSLSISSVKSRGLSFGNSESMNGSFQGSGHKSRAISDTLDSNGSDLEKATGVGGFRKFPLGRLKKWMGDLSLQVCSPRDAIDHYSRSIDESRSLNDQMWLAGALEGYAVAVLMLIQQDFDFNSIPALVKDLRSFSFPSLYQENNPSGAPLSTVVKLLMIAEERAAEAIGIYSKSVVFCALEVECALRIAKLHELFTTSPRFKSELWPGSQPRALSYTMRAVGVPGLNTQQQIECTIEGSLICKRIGMQRKYAFLLYIAAILSAENGSMSMAHALLDAAALQYGISTIDLMSGGKEQSNTITADPQRSWSSMRTLLLENCAISAYQSGDTHTAARYVAALLRAQSRACSDLLMLVTDFMKACEYTENLAAILRAEQSPQTPQGPSHPPQEHPPLTQKSKGFTPENSNGTRGTLWTIGSALGLRGFVDSRKKISEANSPNNGGLLQAILAMEKGSNGTTPGNPSTADSISNFSDTSVEWQHHMRKFFPHSFAIQSRSFGAASERGKSSDQSAILTLNNFSSEFSRYINIPDEMEELGLTLKSLALPLHQSKDRESFDASTPVKVNDPEAENEEMNEEDMEALALALGRHCSFINSQQQTLAMGLLHDLSDDLAPACSVLIPELLYCLSPLHLPDGVKPEVIPAQQLCSALRSVNISRRSDTSRTPKGLFYDPSEHRTKKGEMLVWAERCVCSVVAVLFNPLAVPLHFSSARIILNEQMHIVHEQEVFIPARCQRLEVRFSVVPHSPGQLTIAGLELRMGALVHKIIVDENGYPLPCRTEESAALDTDGYRNQKITLNEESQLSTLLHRNRRLVNMTNEEDLCPRLANTTVTVAPVGPTVTVEMETPMGLSGGGAVEVANIHDQQNRFLELEPRPGIVHPLALYNGERKRFLIKVHPSEQTGNMTGKLENIADFRIIAHQWETGGPSGQPMMKSIILKPFQGPLKQVASESSKDETTDVNIMLLNVSHGPGPSAVSSSLTKESMQIEDQQMLHLELMVEEQSHVLGVSLEIEVVGWDDAVHAFESAMGAGDASHVRDAGELSKHFSSGSERIYCRRCRVKMPVIHSGGLWAQRVKMETGIFLEPYLSEIEKALTRTAVLEIVKAYSSEVGDQNSLFQLRALDVPSKVILVLRNSCSYAAALYVGQKVLLPADAKGNIVENGDEIDNSDSTPEESILEVPRYSTRNFVLSSTQSMRILGSNGHGDSWEHAIVQWRMPKVKRGGSIVIKAAQSVCPAPPTLLVKVQLCTPENRSGTESSVVRVDVGSSSRLEIEVEAKQGSNLDVADYELVVVSIGCTADQEDNLILGGAPSLQFNTDRLPLNHCLTAWHTSGGTSKVLALIRRIGQPEWFCCSPVSVIAT